MTKTSPIVRCPTSSELFVLARSWLTTSINHHKHKRDYTSSLMPTRLVKIQATNQGGIEARIIEQSQPKLFPTSPFCTAGVLTKSKKPPK